MREKKHFVTEEKERGGGGELTMPDKEIYKNNTEALFYRVKLVNFSGLSLVLNKEKDCDCKRHLSWVGYTPLVEVNQAILAWSF